MTKSIISVIMILILAFCAFSGCGQKSAVNSEPDLNQIFSICDLATLKCYYHNVA